mgnify:FL=1
MVDIFSLATAAIAFAGSFGGSGSSPPADHPESKATAGSSFLDFDFLKSGAKALVASQNKKNKPFQSVELPRPRPVSQLTKPKSFQPVKNMRFITGAENADIQNAMRRLANSSNRDIIRLIPMDMVSPVKKQTKNIALGSSDLGKIN